MKQLNLNGNASMSDLLCVLRDINAELNDIARCQIKGLTVLIALAKAIAIQESTI